MRPTVRDLAVVLAVSWLVRAVFIAAIGDAHSADVGHWEGVLAAQDQGRNPYELGVLNWPPLWLVVLVAVDYAANLADVAFWTALRVYLIAVESALIVTLYLVLVANGGERRLVRRALLVGIALNPVAIILSCQHGNSDVKIGLLVTLAVATLAAYGRSRDIVLWLAGCLFLGLGVLAKTVPLVLAPLLAPGARLVGWSARGLGAALLLGPAALGMAVILALAPVAVIDHVIRYRSTRGFFAVSGLVDELATYQVPFAVVTVAAAAVLAGIVALWRASSPASPGRAFLLASAAVVVGAVWLVAALDRLTDVDGREHYSKVFTLALLLALGWLFRRLWSEEPPDAARLFLLVAVMFMALVAFGSGYGPQYAYWFLPALVATYVLLDDGWRRLLRVAWVVAALTYAIEYAVVPFLGAWAVAMLGESDWATDLADALTPPHHLVVFRLPLFVTYLVVIAAGIDRFAREHGHPAELGGDTPASYDAKL